MSDGRSTGGCGRRGVSALNAELAGASRLGRLAAAHIRLVEDGRSDRSLGETGHLGDSRRCSIAVGDLMRAHLMFEARSEADGRSVGVLADDSVLDAGADAGAGDWLAFADRGELRACWLFFLERMPELADEAREVAPRDSGLVGEGSRDGRGDGAADDDEDAADGCEANLDGPDSAMGVIVAVLAEDSREYVG